MARGNQKSTALKVNTNEDASANIQPMKPIGEIPPLKTPAKAMEWLLANRWTDLIDPDADNGKYGKAINSFLKVLKNYTAAEHNTTEGHKDRRWDVMDTFEQLPKAFQEVFAVPNSELSKIVRFADHKSNDLNKNVGAACGFTTDPYYAKSFAEGDKGQNPVYVHSDMESYRGSIDFEKLGKAFKSVIAKAEKKEYNDDGFYEEGGILDRILGASNIGMEKEKFFFGIKWKPEVDTPKWRKERIEEGKLISEDPKYFKPKK